MTVMFLGQGNNGDLDGVKLQRLSGQLASPYSIQPLLKNLISQYWFVFNSNMIL